MIPKILIPLSVILALLVSTSALCEKPLPRLDLQIDRIGPAKAGMKPAVAARQLGIPLTSDKKVEDEAACHYLYPNGKSGDVGFMIEDGKISRIDVYSTKIAAIGGIRIGGDEKAIHKAFPGKVSEEVQPHVGEDGKFLIVRTKPGFAFVFETNKGKIKTFRAGKAGSVQYHTGCP